MSEEPLFIAPERFDAGEFIIRCYTTQDGEALNEAVNASFEHLKPWMPWAKEQTPLAESQAHCRKVIASYLTNQDFGLGIWHEEKLIGGTGFHLRHGSFDSGVAEIGMWIRGSHAAMGLGSRALKAMVDWGFTEWPWQRLVWKCDETNLASARVAEKCGMKLEGTLRSDRIGIGGNRCNTRIYATLADEWR